MFSSSIKSLRIKNTQDYNVTLYFLAVRDQVLRRTFGPKRGSNRGKKENGITRSFIICTFRKILMQLILNG
jgi:hypothetical protein